MPLDWIDVSTLSFNSLLLLERVQLSWFPGWVPEAELGTALRANPVVAWYLRHKCPELDPWLDGVMASGVKDPALGPDHVRQAEETVLGTITDLLTYVVDPAAYDALSFLNWDDRELTDLVDFQGTTVLDVGSGTGRLALVAAEQASVVYAVEPVANLRRYIRGKAQAKGYRNIYPADGLITELPFPDGFADITMGGHVFGDLPEQEYRELVRVTRPNGMVVLCPGNGDRDDETHTFLVSKGFEWSRFEEPEVGVLRKYWLRL